MIKTWRIGVQAQAILTIALLSRHAQVVGVWKASLGQSVVTLCCAASLPKPSVQTRS